jgi:hypothetical protein
MIPDHLSAAAAGNLASGGPRQGKLTYFNLDLLNLEENAIGHPLISFKLLPGFPRNPGSIKGGKMPSFFRG